MSLIKRHSKRVLVIVSVLVTMLFAGVGMAFASIPDPGSVIHSCYSTSGGQQGTLKAIDTNAGQSCPSGTAALNWNQAGGDGLVTVQNFRSESLGQPQHSTVSVIASCPSGYVAVGGGYQTSGALGFLAQEQWIPYDASTNNSPGGHNYEVDEILTGTPSTDSGSWILNVYVNCLPTTA